MVEIETSTETESYRDRCEDRVAVLTSTDRTVVVVADGAGGVGSGDVAADAILREVEAAFPYVHSADQWSQTLRAIDHRISSGESTAVVVDIRPYGIAGASVGDSEAWIIRSGDVIDLTARQARKPLLGSGNAAPTAFRHACLDGVLLVATDGLFSYAKRDELTALITRTDFYSVARQCLEMVRLPSGDLWDDIGIVAARVKPRVRTRQRYSV